MNRETSLHCHAPRLRGLDCRRAKYGVALLMLIGSVSAPSAALGVEVVPADGGVKFDQVDFRFPGIPDEEQLDSDWGRLEVTMGKLKAATGITSGYLNVYTEMGWVVQNLWVNAADPFPAVATYFDLGVTVGTDVTQLSAYVDLRSSPTVMFTDGSRDMFDVGVAEYNAQGAGTGRVQEIGAPPPPNAVAFTVSRTDFVISLPNLSNVQTAMNQCVPMAIANSLQYLEDRFGVNVLHDHEKGLKGDSTLVGQLDTAMDRKACTPIVGNQCTCQNDPPTRTDGCGVTLPQMFNGKFQYLAANNLTNALVHKHQGYGLPPWNVGPGDYTKHGSTSFDQSPPNGQVTWEWICDELAKGEDVELVYSHSDGAHMVRVFECGETGGIPWLGYAHDSLQTHQESPPGDAQGLEPPPPVRMDVTDIDTDGVLNLGVPDWEIRFVLSESPPARPPTVSEWGMVVLALLLLTGIGIKFGRRGTVKTG